MLELIESKYGVFCISYQSFGNYDARRHKLIRAPKTQSGLSFCMIAFLRFCFKTFFELKHRKLQSTSWSASTCNDILTNFYFVVQLPDDTVSWLHGLSKPFRWKRAKPYNIHNMLNELYSDNFLGFQWLKCGRTCFFLLWRDFRSRLFLSTISWCDRKFCRWFKNEIKIYRTSRNGRDKKYTT